MSSVGPSQRSSRRPTRRAVLRAGTGAAVAAVAAGLTGLGSCTRTPPQPDELEAALAAARADAGLADALVAARPDLAARVRPVAGDRRAHADALDREVRRARPDRADALDAAPPPPPVPAPAADGVAALRDALTRARDGGRTLALGTTGYRCGLLASVAACCAGHVVELT